MYYTGGRGGGAWMFTYTGRNTTTCLIRSTVRGNCTRNRRKQASKQAIRPKRSPSCVVWPRRRELLLLLLGRESFRLMRENEKERKREDTWHPTRKKVNKKGYTQKKKNSHHHHHHRLRTYTPTYRNRHYCRRRETDVCVLYCTVLYGIHGLSL